MYGGYKHGNNNSRPGSDSSGRPTTDRVLEWKYYIGGFNRRQCNNFYLDGDKWYVLECKFTDGYLYAIYHQRYSNTYADNR